MACTIRVGGEHAEFLAITILHRSRPGSSDYWDANWLRATVEVAAGGFHGEVHGDLRALELASFHRELLPLAESLSGVARFFTMEEWLSIDISADGRGHIELSCTVRDALGGGNSLAARLELDQTYLVPMIAQLERAMLEFPVIGRRHA